MQMSAPRGSRTVMSLRLCSLAPWTTSSSAAMESHSTARTDVRVRRRSEVGAAGDAGHRGGSADLVARLELAPDPDLGFAGDAAVVHHRADLRVHALEEAVEALRVRPLVDDHHAAVVGRVEAVGDH